MAAYIILRRHARRQLRKDRVFRDRLNPLELFDDRGLIERYRLPRDVIISLTDVVSEDLEHRTKRSEALPVQLQVLATLRFYAKGSFLSETSDTHGISKAAASVCISNVTSAICRHVNLISFPSSDEDIRQTKIGFHQIDGFPNVIGVVDCSQIPIKAPSEDEPTYVCRKGFHAINIQAIVDPNLKFTNVVSKWPGSVHDAFIWSNSAIGNSLQGGGVDGWLVGDSGYALRPWLLTPKQNAVTTAEKAYNRSFKTTRFAVERAFGVLKSRFRCLHKSGGSLQFKPSKCCKVILAVCQLHSMSINHHVPDPETIDYDEPDDAEHNGPLDADGKAVQDRLINTRFA